MRRRIPTDVPFADPHVRVMEITSRQTGSLYELENGTSVGWHEGALAFAPGDRVKCRWDAALSAYLIRRLV